MERRSAWSRTKTSMVENHKKSVVENQEPKKKKKERGLEPRRRVWSRTKKQSVVENQEPRRRRAWPRTKQEQRKIRVTTKNKS